MTTPPKPDVPDLVIAEPYLFGIMALGLINGLFSPLTFMVFLLQPFWYPFFLPSSPGFVQLFASLITATGSIMLAGIPAALYERFVGGGRTSLVSLWIWISALALLSMPAVMNLVRGGLF